MALPDGKLIIEHVYHWEKTAPNRRYFNQPTGGGQLKTYTWGEAMDEARRIATYINSLDLPPKSHIALVSKNTAWWIICDLAIWISGHVSVPVYPTSTRDTVQYVLEHSDSKLCFFGKLDDPEEIKAGIPEGMTCVAMPLSEKNDFKKWEELVKEHEPMQGETERDPEEMATIVYTSGSTGQPKGVMQTFGSFKVCGTLLQELFPLDTSDRMLSYLPLAHVAERLVVENNSTYHGFHVFFAESLDTFLADLQRAQPTMFFSVPRLWTKFHLAVCDNLPLKKQKLLFRLPILGKKIKRAILTKLGLQHVRVAFTGAAPLPPSILAWYRSLGLDLLEAYGMSENFAYSHFTRPNDAKDGHIGPPNPGVECRIDPATGEIQVKSPAQMLGYFKAPDKTAECYTDDGYFKTGDMGEEDEAGRLRVTGRVKELFKTSKGKYVAPVPIENKLGNHPRVEVVCVAGANRPAPYAMVLLAEDTRQHLNEGQVDRDTISEELGSLLELVNPQLDAHERVQFLAIVNDVWDIENGFLTPTMKIRRNIIEKHYADHEDGWYAARSAVLWQSA